MQLATWAGRATPRTHALLAKDCFHRVGGSLGFRSIGERMARAQLRRDGFLCEHPKVNREAHRLPVLISTSIEAPIAVVSPTDAREHRKVQPSCWIEHGHRPFTRSVRRLRQTLHVVLIALD